MYLDQTRYKAYHDNPERYRIQYQCDIVPTAKPYGLARGTALHVIAEMRYVNATEAQINARLDVELPGAIYDKPKANAWALWRVFEAQKDPRIKLIASEAEFVFPIPGSPHSMVGRIDGIEQWPDGSVWVEELKTAYYKANFNRKVKDWETDIQADYEMIGARHLGYDVKGLQVKIIVEKTPIVIWPLEVRRSDTQLERTKLSVHQTCEIIEFMVATFGIDDPWPHRATWPCGTDKCEQATICQRSMASLTPADLAGMSKRKEHLDCMIQQAEEK